MAINNQSTSPVESSLAVSQGVTPVNQKIQTGGGFLNIILAIVLIGLVVLGTFLFFDQGNVMNQTNQMDKDLTDLKLQITAFKGQKVEVSQNAQAALTKIEQAEVRWSEVISEVNKLLPRDASGKSKVEVISYAGTEQGRIALNIVTQPTGIPSFDIVSNLISTFNNSVFFKNALIPSISKGQTENGESTLSFVLNMNYQKPETGTAGLDLGVVNNVKTPVVKTSTNDLNNTVSDSTKVPRNN